MRYACLLTLALLLTRGAVAENEAGDGAAEAQPTPTRVVLLMKTTLGDVRIELFADEAPKTVENFVALAEGTKEFKDPKTGGMVKRPFFDGLIFHRVIKDFMIQGGCPFGTGAGTPGYTFEDEISGKALGLDKLKVIQGNQPHPWIAGQLRSQADFRRMIVDPLFRKMGITSQEDLDARQEEVQKALGDLTIYDAYTNLGYVYKDDLESRPPTRGVLAMANSGPNTNGSQFFINLKDTPWLSGKHTVFGRVIEGMDVVDKIGAVEVRPGDARPLEDVKIVSIRLAE